ncbi:MAG: hypothetical protein A3F68_08360 [Acidobacteria bacterium RIFCSPLOWO2_12_FULL_54_10]|nr:MAG: hypothetical protein A3F68_08360 [Acidobacteria bacterium RIFCSPLOWO2_12_FULL_54_10]
MRNPLLSITGVFAAGIWFAPHAYLSVPEQLLILGVILLSAAVLLRADYYGYGMACALSGIFVCGILLAAIEHAYLPPNHIESLAERGMIRAEQPVVITGWAVNGKVARPGGETIDLAVSEVQQAGRKMNAEGSIRLYFFNNPKRNPLPPVAAGTRLRLNLRDLRRPRNYMTPGSFDWEAYSKRRGIYFTGLVRDAEDLEILPGRGGSAWTAEIDKVRRNMLANLDKLFPTDHDPVHKAAILKAMLLGEDDWIGPESELLFQESGTYHVLVVSGFHVAALAIVLLWLLAALRVPNLLGTLVVAGSVIGFTTLAGSGIPLQRATLMVLIYLGGRLIYRERALLNSISAAALILLILHPSDLRDASFQLSFLAVVVLATLALPLGQWTVTPYRMALRDLENKELDQISEPKKAQFRQDMRILLRYISGRERDSGVLGRATHSGLTALVAGMLALGEALIFTMLMQAGFALVMAQYFQRLAWSGVMANLAVLTITAVLIPYGFVVLAAAFIWWPVAQAGAWLLGQMVQWVHAVVSIAARMDWLNYRVPGPPWWVAAGSLAALLLLVFAVSRRSRWSWIGGGAVGIFSVILTVAPYTPVVQRGNLEINVLDVGQGDSILVSFPRGSTMLIDGGGAIPVNGAPPSVDIGESVVSPYLWKRRIQWLDIVVLTHAHWDHLGGLYSVLKNFQVRELWVGPGAESENLDRLLRLAAARGVKVQKHYDGYAREVDGVNVAVLSPPKDWGPRRVGNNDSLVLDVTYGARRFMLPGDVESRMERRLAELGGNLKSDVLKVPHHGSRSSSTTGFLTRVAPAFGIISVGAFRRFGHPHEEVLEALEHAGIRVYRTDQDGTTTVESNGQRMMISTYRENRESWPMLKLH